MDKILILGINGFTGIHFQNYIIKNNLLKNFSFIGVDKKIKKLVNRKYVKTDLLKYKNLERLLISECPDYIINLVGVFKAKTFDILLNINAGIPKKILEIVVKKKVKIKKILFIGSAAEYGISQKLPIKEDNPLNPVNDYGLSKVIQSQYIKYYFNNYDLNINLVRTFNVIGNDMIPFLSIGSFVNQIKQAHDGGNIYVGQLNTKRDFLDISDVIDGYWKILFNGKNFEIYNLCSGKSYYIKEILDFLIKKSGKGLNVIVNNDYIKDKDISDSYGDNSKIKIDTKWDWKINIFDSLNNLI